MPSTAPDTDPGDVFYIRSTDGGVTFSAPFKLNTDSTTRPQWQPNLSVSPGGTVFALWYDARESTSCSKGNPSVPCYRMWGRKSTDNGATWLADMEFSDVVAPLPGQSDPFIVAGYAGDYDYGSALLTKHVTSWDDGRVAISGASQQDTFFDQEPAGGCNTNANSDGFTNRESNSNGNAGLHTRMVGGRQSAKCRHSLGWRLFPRQREVLCDGRTLFRHRGQRFHQSL